MINTYNDFRDGNGNLINGRTKLFVINTLEDNTIAEHLSGVACVPEGNGTMFIVDDWLIPQIDKVVFKDGTLQVKDGKQLDEPVKSELQLEEEALLKRLAELQAKKNTEESTDEPL